VDWVVVTGAADRGADPAVDLRVAGGVSFAVGMSMTGAGELLICRGDVFAGAAGA
jgi:hypothetical protein